MWAGPRPPTFLAVRLSVLHVEEAVAERLPAGGAHEAGGVPRLPQSVHHFLSHTNTTRLRHVCVCVFTTNPTLLTETHSTAYRQQQVISEVIFTLNNTLHSRWTAWRHRRCQQTGEQSNSGTGVCRCVQVCAGLYILTPMILVLQRAQVGAKNSS